MRWYNDQHKHSNLALLTPTDMHYGRAGAVVAARQRVLDAAHAANPERYVHGLTRATDRSVDQPINPPVATENLRL